MSEKVNRIRVAIDGPAGAGKSSVARAVAEKLKLQYLDTGAMYRAITLKVIREGVALDDREKLSHLLDHTNIHLINNKVYLDHEDVSEEIRLSPVNAMVSPVSCLSQVRRALVRLQQEIADKSERIIMEGRDIGSRVMPDAEFKYYLDASLEERARRRLKEQLAKGIPGTIEEVAAEIYRRDEIDSNREDSPLTKVKDATIIDTTGLTFDEVVEKISRNICEGIKNCR